MFHGHLDCFQKNPSLGGRPNTEPGDHGTPNTHNCWFIRFYHVWGPARIKKLLETTLGWGPGHIYMTSNYTRGSVTALHDFGGVLGRPWDTFFWTLTTSWSRLLARVWSGPYVDVNGGLWEYRQVPFIRTSSTGSPATIWGGTDASISSISSFVSDTANAPLLDSKFTFFVVPANKTN